MNDAVDRSVCFFCGEGHAEALEEHHIVPRRLNGSDEPENRVWLCGSCHNKIEQLYDDEFYRRLDVAVDELHREPQDRTTTGVEVDPRDSVGRSIPPHSPHTAYERWTRKLTVTEIEENTFSGEFAEFISNTKEDIQRQYKQERQSAESPQETANQWDQTLPEWVDSEGHIPVKFPYEHSEMARFPALVIHNPEMDCVNREMAYETARKDSEDELEEFTYVFPDNYFGELRDAKINENMEVMDDEQSYPDYYRLHCGYCHTAFSMHEHADMARHLRMRHGIESPYETADTTFQERAETELFNGGLYD